MNRRLISVLFFALVVAGATSYFLYRMILVRVQSQGHPVAANKLVVAKHDLQVGTLVRDSDLDEVSWGGPIPDDAVKTLADAAGRGVIATIYQNEPILAHRLATKGAGAGLAATIPMGMRAVALRVNEVVGLAGFVVPGMRVDVLMAGATPGQDQARSGTLCRTILQNIEVLSAGQKIEKTTDGKPESAEVVNLLVSPGPSGNPKSGQQRNQGAARLEKSARYQVRSNQGILCRATVWSSDCARHRAFHRPAAALHENPRRSARSAPNLRG